MPNTESPKPAEFCAPATAPPPPTSRCLGPDPAAKRPLEASSEEACSHRLHKRQKEGARIDGDASVSAPSAVLAATAKPGEESDAIDDEDDDDDDGWINTDTVDPASADFERTTAAAAAAPETLKTDTPISSPDTTGAAPEIHMVDSGSEDDHGSSDDPAPTDWIKTEVGGVDCAIADTAPGGAFKTTPTPATIAPAPSPRVIPPTPTGRLPAGWTLHYSPIKNKWYFYHKATGTSTYDKATGTSAYDKPELAVKAGSQTPASNASNSCCACTDPIRHEYVTNENDTYASIKRDLECSQDTLKGLNPKHSLGVGYKFKKGDQLNNLAGSARKNVKKMSRCHGCAGNGLCHASCTATALSGAANTVRLRTCGRCDKLACGACVWTCAATENDDGGKDCDFTVCRPCYLEQLKLTGEQGEAFWARIRRRTKDNDATLRCEKCPAVCDLKAKGCNMEDVGGRSVICEGCDRSRCYTCAGVAVMTLPDDWFCNRIECRREKSRRHLEQRVKELETLQANSSSRTNVVLPRVRTDGGQTSMTLAQYISAAVEIKPAKSDLLDIAVGLLEHLNDLHAKNGVHARLQLSSIKISLAADTKCVIGLTVSPGSPDEPISWKFRAPELFTEELDTSMSDIYSCGVVLSLLFALGGVVPYPDLKDCDFRSAGPEDDVYWDEVHKLHPIVKEVRTMAQQEMVQRETLQFAEMLKLKLSPSLGGMPDASAILNAVQPDQSGAAAAPGDLEPHRIEPPTWVSQYSDLAGLLRDSQNQTTAKRPKAIQMAAAARAALRSEIERTQSLQRQFFRSAARGGFKPRSLLNVQWSEQKCNQQLKLVEPFKAWLQEHRYMSHEIPGLELALERALIAAGSQMLLPSLVTLAGNHSDVIQPDSFLDRWLNAFDESLKETSDPDRLGCIAPNALDEFLERAWNNGDFTDGNFVVAAVAEDCPIVELVGQGGLHAKGPRNKNTIVGLFGGKLEESREAMTDNKLPTDLAAENQYSLTLSEVPKARHPAHDDTSEQLINCYPDKGNSTMMINNGSSTSGRMRSDPDDNDSDNNNDNDDDEYTQTQSQTGAQSTPSEAALVNTKWLEIGYHGWSYNLVFLTRDVQAGEQLLVDYGAGYWDNKVRLENVKDSIEIFSASAIGQAPIT